MGWHPGRIGWRCRLGLQLGLTSLLVALGCATAPPLPEGPYRVTAPHPSSEERYCAWYGDSDGDTLYVGLSPFWWAMRRAEGDPGADLRVPGPQRVGRFDLASERWLPPLEVAPAGEPPRSGVWDVHVHDGDLYYTTFFEKSGRVDLASGEVAHFDAAGPGLNELAEGPDGLVLVSRYGAGDGAKTGGELLTLDASGNPQARWSLPARPGTFAAPKTPAWNPVRRRLIATSDLLPEFEGETFHDAYELEDGGEWLRSAEPELQFAVATPDGTEYRAEVHADGRLFLRRILAPGATPEDARVLLDGAFPRDLDFVQDLKPAEDGRLVVTRWSGAVHVVARDGSVETLQLPRFDRVGLYYTGVIHGDRLCVSYCADVTVVCTDAP